jgi:hypothetical protein
MSIAPKPPEGDVVKFVKSQYLSQWILMAKMFKLYYY